MKAKIILIVFFSLLLVKLFSQVSNTKTSIKLDTISTGASDDSLEFELLVFDVGFESYLVTRAKPKEFYSQAYYENWNLQYIISWNALYAQAAHTNIIDCYIDYFPEADYGLEVNFKLYNYFQYIEEKYKVKLIERY